MTNKELRNKARLATIKNSPSLTGATFIYGAIYVLVAGVILYAYSMNLVGKGVFNSIESMELYMEEMQANYGYAMIVEAVGALVTAFMASLLAGLQYMCISNARGNEIKASDVFYAVKRNPDKVIILSLIKSLLSFVFAIPVNVLAIMSDKMNESLVLDAFYLIFLIISYVCDFAVAILLSQSIFEYLENPDGSIMSYVENSMSMMRNNAKRYFLLYLSFIPLRLIALFTMGLMYLWLLPYMWTTYSLFYMDLKGEHQQGSTIDVTIY